MLFQSLSDLYVPGLLHAQPVDVLQTGNRRSGRPALPAAAADLPDHLRLRHGRHRADRHDLRQAGRLSRRLDHDDGRNAGLGRRRAKADDDDEQLFFGQKIQLGTLQLVQVSHE